MTAHTYPDGSFEQRIMRAEELLRTTRHMALATVNTDGSPHNSPVFFAFNTDLNFYWASFESTQHSQNITHDGRVFIVIFDSHQRGGGLYIQAQAQPTSGNELVAGLEPFNARRKQCDRPAFAREVYEAGQSQRLYRAVPTGMWVNVSEKEPNGEYRNEYRRHVTVAQLQAALRGDM